MRTVFYVILWLVTTTLLTSSILVSAMYLDTKNKAIAECERELPRTQSCKVVITAILDKDKGDE